VATKFSGSLIISRRKTDAAMKWVPASSPMRVWAVSAPGILRNHGTSVGLNCDSRVTDFRGRNKSKDKDT
jgi:hypothetical protein